MRRASLPVLAIAREISEDRKLTTDPFVRIVSATHIAQGSCPLSCPLRFARDAEGNVILDPDGNPQLGGCYANHGHQAFVTRRLNAAPILTDRPDVEYALAHAVAVGRLSGRWPLRVGVVGDHATPEAVAILREAIDGPRGYKERGEYLTGTAPDVWCYTHAWRDVPRFLWGSISVLASCETAQDVADATARGYAVALVYSDDLPREVAGLRTFQCPQQTGGKPDCEACGVCAKDTKLAGRAVLGLKAHGATRQVRAAIERRQQRADTETSAYNVLLGTRPEGSN